MFKDKNAVGAVFKEKQAVEAAIDQTKDIPTGEEQLKVIDLVYWKNTHTLRGAAMEIPCHYETARHWHTDFVKRVAKNFGLLE